MHESVIIKVIIKIFDIKAFSKKNVRNFQSLANHAIIRSSYHIKLLDAKLDATSFRFCTVDVCHCP